MEKKRLQLPKDLLEDLMDVQDIKNPMFGGVNFMKEPYCSMFFLMYKCSLNSLKLHYSDVMKILNVEQARASQLIRRFSNLGHNGHAKFLIKDKVENGKYITAPTDVFDEILMDYPKLIDRYRIIKGLKKVES